MKYAWIRDHRDSYPIAAMCRVLQVSTAGYYTRHDRPPSPRAERTDSHGVFGSVKITKKLAQSPDREQACRNTVAKAMRELGLKVVVPQPFKPRTTTVDPSHKAAPNTLAQNFTADAPNRKWVTDITYLKTVAGWVCLAVVLDVFSRKVLGWHLGASLATELVATALRNAMLRKAMLGNAIELRRPKG